MECLDANQVQDLMAGGLDAVERQAVLGHLDTCDDCRELVGMSARGELTSPMHQTMPYPDRLIGPRTVTDASNEATVPSELALDQTAMAAAIGLASVTASAAATTRITPPGAETAEIGEAALGETADASDQVARTRTPSSRLVPPREPTPPPSEHQFGRYELVERLGAGAMGVVWRAHDPKLGRRIALKLLKRRDVLLTERLVREAQAMAQVSHPNVVAVYDVGAVHGATYIAMELVEGKSLRAWQTAKRRTITEIVTAYVAAGRGLAAAHGAGIVHRDFKADNVLVADDGRVRVTDFGLAAAKFDQIQKRTDRATSSGDRAASDSGAGDSGAGAGDSGDDTVHLTRSGALLGTPMYMAPEQFTGGNVDPRTDQFNFCAALYEALYGERAFAGAKLSELAENVVAGRVKPPPPGAQVSRGLRAILLRGLAPKPADRFPSMEQLLAVLGRDRARPWWRASVAFASLAFVLALGAVADWIVHGRVGDQIRTSFALTGSQLELTTQRLRDFFNDSSKLALREPSLIQLAAHRDQADFGLGAASADTDELEHLHETFVSADLPKLGHAQLAILDYKGRLMYSSYAPSVWGKDMRALPHIRAALDTGAGQNLGVVSYAELAPTQLLGKNPRTNGLVLMFLQTLTVGANAGQGDTREARAIWLVLEDGDLVLHDLRLDGATKLALVAPDGTAIGDPEVTAAQIEAARHADGVVEIGGYEVQARPLAGLDDKPIATVVMARPMTGVLTLFPGARLVFALAALAALALAIGTSWRARRITRAQAVI